MADTKIEYQELRFDIRDPQITHAYVAVKNVSYDGFPVGGWYHKAFPARMSVLDILKEVAEGREDIIMWDRGVPKGD